MLREGRLGRKVAKKDIFENLGQHLGLDALSLVAD
jgi:hypothetical protein